MPLPKPPAVTILQPYLVQLSVQVKHTNIIASSEGLALVYAAISLLLGEERHQTGVFEW